MSNDGTAYQATGGPRYSPSLPTLAVAPGQRANRSPTPALAEDTALPVTQLEKPPSVYIATGGGRRAWMTVFGAWFACFATLGMTLSFGLFQAFYLRVHFPSRSPMDIAWIGSAQVALLYLVGIFSTQVAASGYLHHLMISGSFLYVLALFFVSISTRYYQVLVSQGLGCGVAMGLIFMPVITNVRRHMPQRANIAAGLAISGAAFGVLAFTIVLNYCLRNSYLGFPNSVRVAALIVVVALGIANLTIRTAPTPEDQAALPHPMKRAAACKNPAYILLVVGTTLGSLALHFPVFYLQLACEIRDIERDFSIYMFTIYAATFIFGRLIADIVGLRVSPLKLLPVAFISSGLVTAGLLSLKDGPIVTMSIIAGVYGFGAGSVTSLLPVALSGFGGEQWEMELRGDVVHAFVGVAALASGPASGALLGRDLVWWLPIAFVTAMFAFAALFMILSHCVLQRQRRAGESAPTSTSPYAMGKFATGAAGDVALPTAVAFGSHQNFDRLRGESLDQSPQHGWEGRSPSSPTKSERTARTWYTISPPARTMDLPKLPEVRFQMVSPPPRRDA